MCLVPLAISLTAAIRRVKDSIRRTVTSTLKAVRRSSPPQQGELQTPPSEVEDQGAYYIRGGSFVCH